MSNRLESTSSSKDVSYCRQLYAYMFIQCFSHVDDVNVRGRTPGIGDLAENFKSLSPVKSRPRSTASIPVARASSDSSDSNESLEECPWTKQSTKGSADNVDDKDAPPMSMSSSKDGVVLPNESDEPQLFNSDRETPIFVKGKTESLSFEKVLDILLNEHNPDFVCTKQPMHCQQNVSFLIRTSSVRVEDLPYDDNGAYANKGCHTWTFRVRRDPKGELKKTFIARRYVKGGSDYVYLRRKYRTSKSCEEFRQFVSYAEDNQGNTIGGIALLQYNFQTKEKKFEVLAHGNKKDKTVPFLPTNVTTKEKIKEAACTTKPMKAMAKIAQTSSLIDATDSASTPRDRMQIYNMRRQTKEKEKQENGIPGLEARKDKLYSLMLMANQELDSEGESFIHGVSAWPEAMCITGLPYQFHDITRFCCGPLQFYPLCIDTTFNMGEFYVTPTTYKNLLLENVRDGKPPVFIGPTLVHMTRSYSAYCHLASKLKEVEPGVNDLRASVTDGEPGLIKAWKVFYPESCQLRCVKHFTENVKDELKSIGIKGEAQRGFLNHIFGFVEDDIYHEGLLDANDDETFDAVLASLEPEWNKKERELLPEGCEPKFFNWMSKKADMIKGSLSAGVRLKAGLQPGEKMTSNAAEAGNHVLKEAADYEEMSLPEFVVLAKSVALNQHQGLVRAILRKGQYRFKDEYSYLEVKEHVWMHGMTVESRRRHVAKILNLELGASEVPTEPATKTGQLSVPYTSANLQVTESVLSAIWNKASEYLMKPDSVVQLPNEGDGEKKFFVYSRSKPDNPNVVAIGPNGKVSCSCLMYRSTPNICSHSVAVAERDNNLENFLSWVAKSGEPNLYRLSTSNVNVRAAGQKGGKPKRARKSTPPVTSTLTVPLQETLARRCSYPLTTSQKPPESDQLSSPPDGMNIQGCAAQILPPDHQLGWKPGSRTAQHYSSPIGSFPVETPRQTFNGPQQFTPTRQPGATFQQYTPIGQPNSTFSAWHIGSTTQHYTQTGQAGSTSQHYTQTGQADGTSHHYTQTGQAGSTSQHYTQTGQAGSTSQHYTQTGQASSTFQELTLAGQTGGTLQQFTIAGPSSAIKQHILTGQPGNTLQQYTPGLTGSKPWHNSNPFVVTKLSNRVKKCSSCHVEFRSPAGPPFIGLVVRHSERDQYRDKYGQSRISSEANHYYHCTLQCIKSRHPFFHPGLLQVEGADAMDQMQIDYLKNVFGF
ncbi:hypothetical protein ACROYT_G029718 [Oculina patagonica]